jgi:hypothetical protein
MLNGIDAEIGLEIDVQIQHLSGITGLVAYDLQQSPCCSVNIQPGSHLFV